MAKCVGVCFWEMWHMSVQHIQSNFLIRQVVSCSQCVCFSGHGFQFVLWGSHLFLISFQRHRQLLRAVYMFTMETRMLTAIQMCTNVIISARTGLPAGQRNILLNLRLDICYSYIMNYIQREVSLDGCTLQWEESRVCWPINQWLA